MAYRRRHGMTRASTFKEEIYHKPKPEDDTNNNIVTSSHNFSPSSSLAAQAIRASAANRESSLSSADSVPHRSKVFGAYEDTVGRNDSKGFWGVLARKAKAILDDDNNMSQGFDTATARSSSRFDMPDASSIAQAPDRMDHNPTIRKGLDRISTSLNHLGDSFEKAFEEESFDAFQNLPDNKEIPNKEGRTIVENRTADIKEHLRRKGNSPEAQNQSRWEQPSIQASQPQNAMNHENQLKASRDVAMATAAKAKLLLRELKTVKADLAFAKQRCSQLEEENKILRESREKGANPADDDLIRLQLETLLAEKARLAHENSVYARENRFLREIVEYHQLTMQDVVYFDEGSEEVTEVHPFTKMLSISPPSPMSPPSPNSERRNSSSSPSSVPDSRPPQIQELIGNDVPPNTGVTPLLEEEGAAAEEEDDAEKDEAAKTPAESKGQSGNIPSALA